MGALASSLEEFEAIRQAADRAFDLDARLPDMVFRRPASKWLFFEYEALFMGVFWSALTAIATVHADPVVDLVVLTPDAAGYYVPAYNMYPAFSLSVNSDEDAYWAVVNEEPGGDITGAIIHSANVVAVTGPSAKWGIWGDRRLGVAVVQGMPEASDAGDWSEEHGPFLEIDEALTEYIGPNYRGGVPAALSEALVTHFSGRKE